MPFVLKYINQSGQACSQCSWKNRCLGCMIKPEDTNIYDILSNDFDIAIDWNNEFI